MSEERRLRCISNNPNRKKSEPKPTDGEKPWHRDTPVIHSLLPIAPGWTVYALFEHVLPDHEPFSTEDNPEDVKRPAVVEAYPVAAWADVEQRWYQRSETGEVVERMFARDWQAMITLYSGFEMDTSLTIAEHLTNHEGFASAVTVGPGQRLPEWVENLEARATYIAEQDRWYAGAEANARKPPERE